MFIFFRICINYILYLQFMSFYFRYVSADVNKVTRKVTRELPETSLGHDGIYILGWPGTSEKRASKLPLCPLFCIKLVFRHTHQLVGCVKYNTFSSASTVLCHLGNSKNTSQDGLKLRQKSWYVVQVVLLLLWRLFVLWKGAELISDFVADLLCGSKSWFVFKWDWQDGWQTT